MVIVSIKSSEQINSVLIYDHGKMSMTKHYIKMPAVACLIPDCEYVTDDLDAAIVAVLITAHATTHTSGATSAAKVDKSQTSSHYSRRYQQRIVIGPTSCLDGPTTSMPPK